MNLTSMTAVANGYTDESFSAIICLLFVNEAISIVNAELKCNLPFITDVSISYTALSETWIRQVLIPYIAYSIKMNDGSIQEASIFENVFNRGLKRLKDDKFNAIPATYQGTGFSSVYQIDYVSGLYKTFGIPIRQYTIAEYDEYTEYYEGDYCVYGSDDTIYICIRDSQGNLPTDTTYWREYEVS